MLLCLHNETDDSLAIPKQGELFLRHCSEFEAPRTKNTSIKLQGVSAKSAMMNLQRSLAVNAPISPVFAAPCQNATVLPLPYPTLTYPSERDMTKGQFPKLHP